MKKILFSIVPVFFLFQMVCVAQTSNNDAEKSKDRDAYTLTMSQAWLKYSDNDFYGALRLYRSLLSSFPNDPIVNYRVGECYLLQKQFVEALPYLEKSVLTDTVGYKDVYYLLGQVYQYQEDLDKALMSYKNFLAKLPIKKQSKHEVNKYIAQIYTAKDLIAKPIDVTITNLGDAINSKYTDATPSLSADGKTLVFTSRRPETTGGRIEASNNEYYDDIYISQFDEKNKNWSKATQIPGAINTEEHDAVTSISADGNTIFIYKNIENITRSGDIWQAKKKADNTWDKPYPLGVNVNSTYFESSACMTADGQKLYFISEKEHGGYGNGDIYVAERLGSDWDKPKNLGKIVNTPDDEIGVFIHPNGKTLFFTSNGHNSMGGYDIFMTTMQDNGSWSVPVNMGYPVNTLKDELHFVLTTDGSKAYISSNREGGLGKTDIYEVVFNKSKNQTEKKESTYVPTGPVLSILRGSVVDGVTSLPISGATITIVDPTGAIENKEIKSGENGEYFITLPAEINYNVKVEASGLKAFEMTIKLPKEVGKTHTTTKHFILNK